MNISDETEQLVWALDEADIARSRLLQESACTYQPADKPVRLPFSAGAITCWLKDKEAFEQDLPLPVVLQAAKVRCAMPF